MARGMTAEEWEARAEAFEEAATHLNLPWTDDATEQKQGDIAAEKIRGLAKRCREIAAVTPGRGTTD